MYVTVKITIRIFKVRCTVRCVHLILSEFFKNLIIINDLKTICAFFKRFFPLVDINCVALYVSEIKVNNTYGGVTMKRDCRVPLIKIKF